MGKKKMTFDENQEGADIHNKYIDINSTQTMYKISADDVVTKSELQAIRNKTQLSKKDKQIIENYIKE